MLAPIFFISLGLKHSPLQKEARVLERELGRFFEIPEIISDALAKAKVKIYFPKEVVTKPFIIVDYPNPMR